MALLSDKILQLMTYEAQLKTLKKEIVLQHLTLSASTGQRVFEDILKEEIQLYELIWTKYNELFENILQDTRKMVEEYHELKHLFHI
jgi:hypothetical protein